MEQNYYTITIHPSDAQGTESDTTLVASNVAIGYTAVKGGEATYVVGEAASLTRILSCLYDTIKSHVADTLNTAASEIAEGFQRLILDGAKKASEVRRNATVADIDPNVPKEVLEILRQQREVR